MICCWWMDGRYLSGIQYSLLCTRVNRMHREVHECTLAGVSVERIRLGPWDGVYMYTVLAERDGSTLAINDGLVALEPGLAEHNIMSCEWKYQQVDSVGVRVDEQ